MADWEPRLLPGPADTEQPWGAWSPSRWGWWSYLGTHVLAGQPVRFGSAEAVTAWASRATQSAAPEERGRLHPKTARKPV